MLNRHFEGKYQKDDRKENIEIKLFYSGREGTLDSKIQWYPKFFKHDLSLVGLNTLGTLIKS